jgi:hypothetical protein
MRIKKLGMAFLVVAALGAFAASSAFATNLFNGTESAWYVSGTKLAAGTTKTIQTEKAAGSTLSLKTEVAGKKLVLDATGVSCTGCIIENSGAVAIAKGELTFSGVSLTEPEPGVCSAPGTISTKPLKATVGMGGAGSAATVKFEPQAGTSAAFATVEILGSTCSIKGLYKVTGAVVGESANATNTPAKRQSVTFSEAIQLSAAEASSLKFGANNAFLSGTVENFLSPEVEYSAKNS